MSVKPSDITLLLALIEIATKAAAAIKQIKSDNPEVYDAIGEHHADALDRLANAATGVTVPNPQG